MMTRTRTDPASSSLGETGGNPSRLHSPFPFRPSASPLPEGGRRKKPRAPLGRWRRGGIVSSRVRWSPAGATPWSASCRRRRRAPGRRPRVFCGKGDGRGGCAGSASAGSSRRFRRSRRRSGQMGLDVGRRRDVLLFGRWWSRRGGRHGLHGRSRGPAGPDLGLAGPCHRHAGASWSWGRRRVAELRLAR